MRPGPRGLPATTLFANRLLESQMDFMRQLALLEYRYCEIGRTTTPAARQGAPPRAARHTDAHARAYWPPRDRRQR